MTARFRLSKVFWAIGVLGLMMYSLRLNPGVIVVFVVPVALLTLPGDKPCTRKAFGRWFHGQTSNTIAFGRRIARLVRGAWPACVVAGMLVSSQCVYGFARGETAIVTLIGTQLWPLAVRRLPVSCQGLALGTVLGLAFYIAVYPACPPIFELQLFGLSNGNVLIDTQTGRFGLTYTPGMRYEWSGPNTGLIEQYAPHLKPVWLSRPIRYRALVAERSILFRSDLKSLLRCLPHDAARRSVVNAIATDANCARRHQAMLLVCLNFAYERRLADPEALWKQHARCFAIYRDPHEAAKAVYGWTPACTAWLESIGVLDGGASQAERLARRAVGNARRTEIVGEYVSEAEHMQRFSSAYSDLMAEYAQARQRGSSVGVNGELHRCPALRPLCAPGR